MKKRIPIMILLLVLAVLLTACVKGTYQVQTDYGILTIDPSAKTITQGSDVYRYSISGSTTSIHYPNGAVYNITVHHSALADTYDSGWSYDYDESTYIPGDVLYDALKNLQPGEDGGSGHPILALICIGMGIFNIKAPHGAWYLSYGWRFKDAEPSDSWLIWTQVSGGIAILLGILLFFI